MSTNKNPDFGTKVSLYIKCGAEICIYWHIQKVDLGQNAPTKEEGTGFVASESLAAKFKSESGEFASNEGIRPGNESTSGSSTNQSSSNTNKKSTTSAQDTSGSSAGTAPSYIVNQYQRDPDGPHGKNLKEGIGGGKTQDGLKKALNSEPGSEDDPSRLAELQFQQNKTGGEQGDVADKTAFDGLNAETPS